MTKRIYTQEQKERAKARAKDWNLKNPERVKANNKNYRLQNAEKQKAYGKIKRTIFLYGV